MKRKGKIMCFLKSQKLNTSAIEEEKVEQHQANASLTKNSDTKNISNYSKNFKTSPIGLSEDPYVKKNTLLGE